MELAAFDRGTSIRPANEKTSAARRGVAALLGKPTGDDSPTAGNWKAARGPKPIKTAGDRQGNAASLIPNDRTKLLADSIDRVSAACVLGQYSLWCLRRIFGCASRALSFGFWPRLPHSKSETRSQELAAMTFDVFFWYVFPLIVAVGAFGWIAYDRHFSRNDHHLRPGE